MFFEIGKPLKSATNEFIQWLIINYGDAFESFSNGLLYVLIRIEKFLRGTLQPDWIVALILGGFIAFLGYHAFRTSRTSRPFLVPLAILAVEAVLYASGLWMQEVQIIVMTGLLAFVASRKLGLALGIMASMYVIGMLGLWNQAMQTIAIMLVSILIAVLLGVPAGVASARSDRIRSVINPVLDLMQTIPSFVYLIPAAMLFGLGKVPAILATIIYATPPLIRLTDLGIRQVDSEVVEASRAFGATRWQMLAKVQMPLAMPSIMQGINQTTMMALAMVVIASMIGARGIGEIVLLGLQRNDSGQGLLGGVAIVLLAIVFDRISQAFGHRMQAHRQVRS